MLAVYSDEFSYIPCLSLHGLHEELTQNRGAAAYYKPGAEP